MVEGTPGTNQMGDLEASLAWHRVDPPDEFERRRNHTIHSHADNSSYYTNNRIAYIDAPEFAYRAFPFAGDVTLEFLIHYAYLNTVSTNWGRR